MGYLMDKFAWDYTVALSYVQSKRYCVSPSSVSTFLQLECASWQSAQCGCETHTCTVRKIHRHTSPKAPLSIPDTAQFEIQLREYATIAAAQHAYASGPMSPSVAEHKRAWDGEG